MTTCAARAPDEVSDAESDHESAQRSDGPRRRQDGPFDERRLAERRRIAHLAPMDAVQGSGHGAPALSTFARLLADGAEVVRCPFVGPRFRRELEVLVLGPRLPAGGLIFDRAPAGMLRR